ncbi:hypothetical protein [Xanthomonas campestris]|uniref:hypothetical protein n=1 Tax=Xanthomonas campestris TaxID=339 RepID=UPI001E44A4B9|nr:hypothetical protein [Xanthomonas campestris]
MLAALLLTSVACNAGKPAAAVTAQPASRPLPNAIAPPPAAGSHRFAPVIRASGVTCTDATSATGCTAGNLDAGDFYDVDVLPECGDDGFFAGVWRASGAEALDAVPTTGSAATATAHLAQGQLVCIQAIARGGQNPRYYYVVTIPASGVAACNDSALCETYGDRPIRRLRPADGTLCRAAAQGRHVGDCAQGWIDAQALDVFSNGM